MNTNINNKAIIIILNIKIEYDIKQADIITNIANTDPNINLLSYTFLIPFCCKTLFEKTKCMTMNRK